ncbi:MAG: PAS domain S-box protein, partial [Parafilimonas sp.]
MPEQRIRSIIETALDAVVTMNPAGEITEWNAQAERIFGWSRKEAIGRCLCDTIIPPQHRQAHERGLQRFLATGEGPLLNKRIEITALHCTGREFPVELAISSTKIADAWTFSAFVRDISDR